MERVIETQRFNKCFPLLHRRFLTQQVVYWVPDVAEHHK